MAITKKAIAIQEEKKALLDTYRAACAELDAVCASNRVPAAVINGDAVLAATWKDRLHEACTMRKALAPNKQPGKSNRGLRSFGLNRPGWQTLHRSEIRRGGGEGD